jgi:Uma2 family endonuclease
MSLPQAASDTGFVSPEEYLRRERAADSRSEYRDGRIVAMSGASRGHNLIVVNVIAHVRPHLRGGGRESYVADMKVRLVGSFKYVYPDIVVVCGEPQFEDERTDIVTNPTLIIEVLSGSTEAVDRGVKWNGYQRIPSLREYVLVAQDRPSVERYARQGHLWLYEAVEGTESAVTLDSIGLSLPMDVVYEGVTLT